MVSVCSKSGLNIIFLAGWPRQETEISIKKTILFSRASTCNACQALNRKRVLSCWATMLPYYLNSACLREPPSVTLESWSRTITKSRPCFGVDVPVKLNRHWNQLSIFQLTNFMYTVKRKEYSQSVSRIRY